MKVNEGATLCHWSDRHAGTIVWISDDEKTLKWQRDAVIRTDNYGMNEIQKYNYEPNLSAVIIIFTKRANGHWYKRGQKMGTSHLSIGNRSEYYDFSF